MDARLKYTQGNLFNAPKGVALLHACNTKGVWGRGIAVEFKKRFPESYKVYNRYCLNNPGCVGKSLVIEEKGYKIVCIMTSSGFGAQTDSPEKIVKATDKALTHLFEKNPSLLNIHSPKINAGLFSTPWEKTESVILDHLEKSPSVNWTVWEFEP